MAETWEDYGDLAEEEIYQSKSTIGKIFSFRTLGKVLKFFGLCILLLIYGMLAFRLCTQKPPKAVSKLLWTEETLAAYAQEGDNMVVYAHEPAESIAKDGYFGVYDILYIPASKEFQVTVRYNNSSTNKLYDELYEEELTKREDALLAEIKKDETLTEEEAKTMLADKLAQSLASDPIQVDIADIPFVFLLRDDYGNVYTSYDYVLTSQTVYQYMRISFKNVNLFGDARTAPNAFYPTPKTPVSEYIYKGANQSDGNEIRYLFLDMYDANRVDVNGTTFAYPLQVYRNTLELADYDYSNEILTEKTSNLVSVDIGS